MFKNIFVLLVLTITILYGKVTPNTLNLYNIHLKENFKFDFTKSSSFYLNEKLEEFDYFMRDRRTGDIQEMDPKLIILLYKIQKEVGFDKTINVFSGYRSKKTNDKLRKQRKNSSVAKNSLHMKGQAVDINVYGVSMKKLKRICEKLKSGGVGYYPNDGFIHVDVGKVRHWKG